MPRLTARWTDWSGRGLEHLELEIGRTAIRAESVVIPPEPGPALRYRLLCDGAWRVCELAVELVGRPQRLRLVADRAGRWRDGSGRSLPALEGALDVDLAFSPFTNTLPIRRLGLRPGEAADIVAAYVAPPDLAPVPDPQRYTCLEPGRRYRYESRDSDFRRDVVVDRNGLVVDYPRLFRRVG